MKVTKYFSKFFILGLSTFVFTGCSNELNLYPITDKVAPSQDGIVLPNAVEAEKAMADVNAIFGNEYWQFDNIFLGDAGADGAYSGGGDDEFHQIDEYRIISTNYVIGRDWGHIVGFEKRCNKIINFVNTVPDLPQTRKDEMIGEASLHRALNRFIAVQIWGDYPMVSQYVSSINAANFDAIYPSLFPKRVPVAQVYDAIIADCEVALAKAPASTSSPDSKYRASKGAANALLAKVYATKPNPDWAKVIQYSNAVINGGYSLMPTFESLFDNAHEGNLESIWEMNGQGVGSPLNMWGPAVLLGNNWKKFVTPSHTLVNALDPVRLASTIKALPTTFADPYWATYNAFPNPWKMRKLDGTQNFYIFRLADIILIKAEALAHTGDLTGAMTLVNQIRTRVSLPNIAPATSQDDAINKILQERFVELAYEAQRWFDLKREGKSIEILSKQDYPRWDETTETFITTPVLGVNDLAPNDLLWPIPQNVLDNNVNLTQNPGY